MSQHEVFIDKLQVFIDKLRLVLGPEDSHRGGRSRTRVV